MSIELINFICLIALVTYVCVLGKFIKDINYDGPR